ncbi:MAG TPA: hypothetical protein VMX74_12520 [Pirellulales bacterium]|nr:hypothetical protein [Pirellulales bacterium]HUU46411.1 hypothetical protein [Acidobacteriota bacterium]
MAWPNNWTDSETMTQARLTEWTNAIKQWGDDVDTNGYGVIVESSAPTDGDIPTRGVVFYLDETAHALKVRVRYSDGSTLKSGSVTLT